MESTVVQEYFDNLQNPQPGISAMRIQEELPVNDLIEQIKSAFKDGCPVNVIIGFLHRIGEEVRTYDARRADNDYSSPVWELANFAFQAADITNINGATDPESLNHLSRKLLEKARATIVSGFINHVLLDHTDSNPRASRTRMFDHPLFVPVVTWLSRQEVEMFSNPHYASPIGRLAARSVGRNDAWYCEGGLTIPGFDAEGVRNSLCDAYVKIISSANGAGPQIFQRIYTEHEPLEIVEACAKYLWGSSDDPSWKERIYGPSIPSGADLMFTYFPTCSHPSSFIIALIKELWDPWRDHKMSQAKEAQS